MSGADGYFDNRIWSDVWKNLDETTKEAALSTAKNTIESLNVSFRFTDKERITAIYEQALFYVQMNDDDHQRERLKNMGVTSISIKDMGSEQINQNIPLCSYARNLLQKYTYKPGKIR